MTSRSTSDPAKAFFAVNHSHVPVSLTRNPKWLRPFLALNLPHFGPILGPAVAEASWPLPAPGL